MQTLCVIKEFFFLFSLKKNPAERADLKTLIVCKIFIENYMFYFMPIYQLEISIIPLPSFSTYAFH